MLQRRRDRFPCERIPNLRCPISAGGNNALTIDPKNYLVDRPGMLEQLPDRLAGASVPNLPHSTISDDHAQAISAEARGRNLAFGHEDSGYLWATLQQAGEMAGIDGFILM